jgi:hypothetical protein
MAAYARAHARNSNIPTTDVRTEIHACIGNHMHGDMNIRQVTVPSQVDVANAQSVIAVGASFR